MTNNGDDCYFFYYSTCAKGDSCPFRHCQAAMGNETVCSLWQEGRCFRTICKFRHMEITKNRGKIPCYWENQPAGCQKPHCAFLHEKARYIDGIFVPPDKGLGNNEEQPVEETPPPSTATIPSAANPQLRGVMKTDTQELVPSPTHPPVVINPADDDEDEDDQFSEEGDDGRGSSTPRKLSKFDGPLNFGVSTLEEIRLRKALKASMKRAGHPGQSSDTLANGEKENILSFCHPVVLEARDGPFVFEETGRSSRSIAERLGRKMSDSGGGGDVQLKRSLSDRLGGVVDDEEALMPPLKVAKPIKERLGSKPALVPAPSAKTHTESKKVPEQIHIKTLEEIRKEKAANSQPESPNNVTSIVCSASTKAIVTKASKAKRSITVKGDSTSGVQTFSEILRAKKKKQEEQQEQNPSLTKAKQAVEKPKGKNRVQPNATVSGPDAAKIGDVRVKTLEEIRMEKAARIQAQQAIVTEKKRRSNTEDGCAEKTTSLNKVDLQKGTAEKKAEGTAKPPKINSVSEAVQPSSPMAANNIKVKTFEEIMREKRLRRQEMEGAEKNSVGSVQAEIHDPDRSGDTTAPAINRSLSSPDSSSPSSQVTSTDTTPPIQKLPARKLVPLKSKVRPKLNVKPVMKPAVQVNPGPNRKGTEQSATAAVKPLKSSCTELVEPLPESSSQVGQVLPSPNAAVPHGPSTQLESGSSQSPMREEPQTVPVISLSQDTKPAISVATSQEACAVPQSPVPKTPTQLKARRHSAVVSRTPSSSRAASSTLAMDDFDDLINEFTDEQLEDDMDPGIGEDDLLQELAEMIDS